MHSALVKLIKGPGIVIARVEHSVDGLLGRGAGGAIGVGLDR